MSAGTLYGIGVGPGDPELLTLKAYRLIRSIGTIYVPVARPGGRSYARSIVEQFLSPDTQQVTELVFAMREDAGRMEAQWKANAHAIATRLDGGHDAAFLTEGDPFLYSTFMHAAGALAESRPDLPIVVVPGVSSFQAAAAAAHIPLVDKDERMAILPASYERGRLEQALKAFDTVVLLKVASVFDQILDTLEKSGLVERATFIQRCGLTDEKIVRDIRELRGLQLDYFSLLIVRRQP